MRIIFSRAAVVTLVACATACGSLADAPRDDPGAVASAAVTGTTPILICDLEDGSYGVPMTYVAIDADGDGFTVPASGEVCTDGTLPPPYHDAEQGLDCDDADPALAHPVPYAAIDADGDGATVPASGAICAAMLPPPYRAAAQGLDCNDADPAVDHAAVLYPDQDADGVGATPRQLLCIGAAAPPGFVRGGYDEDDADPGVIEDDDDEDLALDL
jgi:hypothetical protein